MKKLSKEKELRNKVKIEAAEELGLADKVRKLGWGNLTSKEAGRIGARLRGWKKKNGNGDGEKAP